MMPHLRPRYSIRYGHLNYHLVAASTKERETIESSVAGPLVLEQQTRLDGERTARSTLLRLPRLTCFERFQDPSLNAQAYKHAVLWLHNNHSYSDTLHLNDHTYFDISVFSVPRRWWRYTTYLCNSRKSSKPYPFLIRDFGCLIDVYRLQDPHAIRRDKIFP